jgi:tol-pal system protein YbgF
LALAVATAALLVVALAVAAPPAGAQDASLQHLLDRVERLQREVQTLQRQVATGGNASAGAPTDATGGTGEPLSSDRALRYDTRLNQFDDLVRQLTGRVEEMEFQVRQASDRLERLSGDVERRLQRLEAGNLASAPDGEAEGFSLMTDEAPQAGAADNGPAGNAVAGNGANNEPGVLGYISESDLQSAPAAPAGNGVAAPAAGGTPQEQYSHAFGLLRQANWPAAEGALRQFLEQHPDDPLAGNAMYWLGETHYVRQDYAAAAKVFAEGFQSYPDSVKAPDNLLKLGMSLSSLKQNEDACGTFIELEKRYPGAAQEILKRARNERQRLGC